MFAVHTIHFYHYLSSYHIVKLRENELSNFDWLVNLLREEQHCAPRMLVFFNDTILLARVYQYLRHHCGQTSGDSEPLVAMFTSLTSDGCKTAVLNDMNTDSKLRVVLCTSSLSVGVNLRDVQHVIHYGSPQSTNAFIQESGRAGREPGSRCSSTILCYPRMNSGPGRALTKPMKDYISAVGCRRVVLLEHYNSTPQPQENCCDNCGAATPYFLHEPEWDWELSSYTTGTSSAGSVGDIPLIDSDATNDSWDSMDFEW